MKIRNEVKVGIFTIIILALLYICVLFLKGSDLFSYNDNKYFVTYEKGGSNPGDSVYINGICVGSVIKTVLDKKTFKLKVFFKISKGIILTDKTVAFLTGPGLIPGRNSITLKFTEDNGIPLKSGSEIKGIINQSFTDQIMNNTIPLLDEVKSTSALISELAGSLAKNQLKINSAIANLEFLTYNIKDYILKNKDFFDDITRSVAKILYQFSDEKYGVGAVVSGLSKTLNKLNQVNMNEINTSIKEFSLLLHKIQKKNTFIGDLVHKGDLYQNLNKMILDFSDTAKDIRTAPYKYFRFSLFGGTKVYKTK